MSTVNVTTVVDNNRISLVRLEMPPFGTNAYILSCKESSQSLLFDAPGESEQIKKQLQGARLQQILLTHSHFDHTGALAELKSEFEVPVAAHSADTANLPLSADRLLTDGDIISCGKIKVKVLHTPGHTPGSLCFLVETYLLSGDTLFPGGPGRTDSPANLKQIINSITGKLFVLEDQTRVFPGHGQSTILEEEKKQFALFNSKEHPPDLCGDVLWQM